MKSSFLDSWKWFVESIFIDDYSYLHFSPFDSKLLTEKWIQCAGNALISLLLKDIGFNVSQENGDDFYRKIKSSDSIYIHHANEIDIALLSYSKSPFRSTGIGALLSRRNSLLDLLYLHKKNVLRQEEDPLPLYSERRYPELYFITNRQQHLFCGVGYLYDAYLSRNLNLIDDAMCYLSGAVAQASEVDIKELSQQLNKTTPKAIAFDERQSRKKEAVTKGGKIRGLQKKHEGASNASLIIHLYHQIRLSPKYKDKSANHLRGIVGDIIDSPENTSGLCRSSIYSILRVANLPYGTNKINGIKTNTY